MFSIGFIMAVIPKTLKILNMLEPIIFPIEISFSFLILAITEEANSGILVPIETTVTAITRSLTPIVSENFHVRHYIFFDFRNISNYFFVLLD